MNPGKVGAIKLLGFGREEEAPSVTVTTGMVYTFGRYVVAFYDGW